MMQTEFLYPLRIEIGRQDLAWVWGVGIHILTATMLLFFVPVTLGIVLILLTLISLRAIWDGKRLFAGQLFWQQTTLVSGTLSQVMVGVIIFVSSQFPCS